MMDNSNSDLLYGLLVQGVVDYAIYLLTPDGIISNWNTGAERAKGYRAHEIVGQHFSRFYPQGDTANGLPATNLDMAKRTGRYEGEGWRVRKDGSQFWAHVVIDAIYDDNGGLLGFAKITKDCTEEKRMQESEHQMERQLRILIDSVKDYAIYMLDSTGKVISWNAGAQRAKGYAPSEVIGRHFSLFYPAEDRINGQPQRALDIARRDGRFEAEGWRIRKDGSRFWSNVVIQPILDEKGVLLGFAKITRDVTERHQQELALRRAKQLAEEYSEKMSELSAFLDSVISNIPAAVIALEPTSRRMLLVNGRAESLFDARVSDPRGYLFHDCFPPAIADFLERQAAAAQPAGQCHASVTAVITSNGERTMRCRSLQGNRTGSATDYTLLIIEDVTEEIHANARIHHMAQHDGLTNLPNRTLFQERLNVALESTAGIPNYTALLCLDIDNFKFINDAFGHAYGDVLLLQVAQRLRASLRESDTLARLGGDEFAIVLPSVRSLAEAQHTAQRLLDALRHPFLIDTHEFRVGLSIGIALSDGCQSTAEQLMRFSDMALYEAKRNGRSRFELFHPQMETMARSRQQVEVELRKALEHNELQMYYQPIIEGAGRTAGYEALIRWNHPSRGLIGPLDFIGIAEETGLIHEVGKRALQLACHEAAGFPPDLFVAVNLSPLQFKSTSLVDTVKAALAESGLAPSRLELEITESVLLDNTEQNVRILRELKALGVTISLDDFGTGYSSLSYLRSFPFDRIKIDKSFVRDMNVSREAMAIIRAITGLSSSLLMQITAEGVETEEQYRRLQAEGCSHFQGFFFGKPSAQIAHESTPGNGKLRLCR